MASFGAALKIALTGGQGPLGPAQRTLFTMMISRRLRKSSRTDVAETPAAPDESGTYVSVVDIALQARATLGERWLRGVDVRRARDHEEPDDPRWRLYLEEAEWVQSETKNDPLGKRARDRNLRQVRAKLRQLGVSSGVSARPRGRPATGTSLKDRESALQEDAIRIASTYPKPPSKKVIAAALAREDEWSRFEESTLEHCLKKSWWCKTKFRP